MYEFLNLVANVDGAERLDDLSRSMGHPTRPAHVGAQAVAVATEFKPDVALTDIGLPGFDAQYVKPLAIS